MMDSIDIEPVEWTVTRAAGWSEDPKDVSGTPVGFAFIRKLDTGYFLVKPTDSRVSLAMKRQGTFDGSGSYGGPVLTTFEKACAVAHDAIEEMLELRWEQDKSRDRVLSKLRARHDG